MLSSDTPSGAQLQVRPGLPEPPDTLDRHSPSVRLVVMPSSPGLRVFFSHSSQDAEWVQRLAAQAVAIGVDIYLAEHDVQPGQRLSDKVTREIEACHAMIVLLSVNSLKSVYVQQEIGVAHHARKLVIPIVMGDVAGADLGILNDREYILLDPAEPQEALSRVSAALSRLIQHQRQQLEKVAAAERQQHEAAALAERQRQLAESIRKSQQQDMIVAGAVLLVIGLIVISQNGS